MRGKKARRHFLRAHRRGAVVVYTAMIMTTLLGFAALTVDIGYLYTVKAELQVSADAAALAGASQLASLAQDRLDKARAKAAEYAAKNEVGNVAPVLETSDVVFGQGQLDMQTGRYTFAEGVEPFDAIRVRVRRTADSPNGAVALFFANIFGKSEKGMWAEATAILIPRDIAIVADLSASHNDDSELAHMNRTSVNLYDVWAALPGGMDEADPNWDPQRAGPTWGQVMEDRGFGQTTIDSSYDPRTDEGLVHLPKGVNWTDAEIENRIRARGYNEDEVAALMSAGYDGDGAWPARVCVAMGLSDWVSGKTEPDVYGNPPKWVSEGWAAQGNGNDWVGYSSEMRWVEPYPYPRGSWSEYCSYMDGWSKMRSQGSDHFRHRFGVKTFLNYQLENRRCYHENPDLFNTPHQPMQAVKDAVDKMMWILDELDTDDQVSLETYAETTTHEIDLTTNYAAVPNRLNQMQAGHYNCWTNMGGGIQRGIDELTSARARPSAIKVMVLLTDGKANVTETGAVGDYTNGPIYAKNTATEAAALGIRIYAVSVGSDADTDTMDEIAEIGNGYHFHAEGSIDSYTMQLQLIFATLGGKRPVMLID